MKEKIIYKKEFKEAKQYVNIDFKNADISIPIVGKKIKEVRQLLGKEMIGIVLDNDTGIVISCKDNKLKVEPVKEFTQTEINLK